MTDRDKNLIVYNYINTMYNKFRQDSIETTLMDYCSECHHRETDCTGDKICGAVKCMVKNDALQRMHRNAEWN